MEKIQWSSEFSVGNDDMDSQHKELVQMINELIGKQNRNESTETMAYTIIRMSNYATMHLEMEEELLRTIDYPDYDEHIKHHNDYRLTIDNFCSASDFGIVPVPLTVLEYLANWWTHHILTEDQKYCDYIESKK